MLVGLFALAQRTSDVRRRYQVHRIALLPCFFLDFLCGGLFRSEIRYGGAENSDICLWPLGHTVFVHLLRAQRINAADSTHRVAKGRGAVSTYERDVRTPACAGLRQSKPHLAGGEITDESHGVDLLLRTSGGD